jgi:hypothetical protein
MTTRRFAAERLDFCHPGGAQEVCVEAKQGREARTSARSDSPRYKHSRRKRIGTSLASAARSGPNKIRVMGQHDPIQLLPRVVRSAWTSVDSIQILVTNMKTIRAVGESKATPGNALRSIGPSLRRAIESRCCPFATYTSGFRSSLDIAQIAA